MWVQIVCGVLAYKVVKWLFYDGDDKFPAGQSNDSVLFAVAKRLEKIYGGKAYVGLRIPDQDTASHQNIDIVLVTTGDVVVISVKNIAGNVSICGDGSWICETGESHKTQHLQDPVEETKKQALVLESYLERRGLILPEGYLSYKVLLPNPKFLSSYSSYFPPEVVTYEQWSQLKSDKKINLSRWFKSTLGGANKEVEKTMVEKLSSVLRTAPMWDRLELSNKYILGEFVEFQGKQDDLLRLKLIKRSKVSQLTIQKTSMLGLAPSKLQVLYSPLDYRNEMASASCAWNEATVSSSTEIAFQPKNDTKSRKFKLSSVISMSLSV